MVTEYCLAPFECVSLCEQIFSMIEITKAFDGLSEEEYTQILDIPVWLSLMAAFAGDGKVSKSEKSEAVKLAHLRTFTSPHSLHEYYKKVDARFDERFETLIKRVPEKEENRLAYLEAQVKRAHAMLKNLDKDIASTLEESLESFYEHVFNADKSFFQYFALPIISNRLDNFSGHYDFSDEEDK
jgi:hypothetical protein